MKRILIIAGSDSSGGAGLEADQRVIAAHGCYAMTATAALTAQNTLGVYDIHETPPDFVRKQIDACVEDIGVDVVKTGMLASASTISVVADALKRHNLLKAVVDPVMVATVGAVLLPENAVKTMCEQLLPLTYLLTPNIPEANLILREAGKPAIEVTDVDSMKHLAAAIQELGPYYVLLKGGHVPLTSRYKLAKSDDAKKLVVNVIYGQGVSETVEHSYQKSKNTHGTGDSLASAIACHLARGVPIVDAVRAASRYVEAGIKTSHGLGKGSGPLNHFHSMQHLPFSPEHFIDYLLERADVKVAWHQYTHHEFVRQLGDGTLPPETFKYYMIQDYLYLIHFARANALAGYKSKSLDDIAGAAAIVTHIRKEIDLHINECKAFGLTQQDMEKYEESQACTAYTRYVLDIGQSEDWLALQISLLPCLLGYSVIAQRLHAQQAPAPSASQSATTTRQTDDRPPNRYKTWIDNYVADDYTAAVTTGCALIEKHAVRQSPARIEELAGIFVHATKMETGFWELASRA